MDTSSPSAPRASTVYGPVASWRFGRSLGIDPILEISTCSFNCIYCQLGAIERITTERRVFVTAAQLREDLAKVDLAKVDVATFSGSGEPTLATNLGELAETVRAMVARPLHLLTNATLLELADVRRDAAKFDAVACKLDAPDEGLFQKMNRPAPGISLEGAMRGIERFRAEYSGTLALQIMLMPDGAERILEWASLIARARPDEIQLNTPRRPYPDAWDRKSRGGHLTRSDEGEGRALRTLSREQAAEAERLLIEATGVRVISVYAEGGAEGHS